MSTEETNAYLQAKLQQAQGQQPDMQPKKAQLPKAKGNKAQTQPEEQPQALVDMQAFRQMIEDVIRAEFQTSQVEQPLDMQAFQQVVQATIRAELQPLQAALTILANAVQAQAEAFTSEDGGEEENDDDLLPTAAPHTTDEVEAQREFPSGDGYDENEAGDDEGEGEGGGGESYPRNPPRPESPTHRLRRPGPVGIHLGGNTAHPSQGTRRWEPSYEQ